MDDLPGKFVYRLGFLPAEFVDPCLDSTVVVSGCGQTVFPVISVAPFPGEDFLRKFFYRFFR